MVTAALDTSASARWLERAAHQVHHEEHRVGSDSC